MDRVWLTLVLVAASIGVASPAAQAAGPTKTVALSCPPPVSLCQKRSGGGATCPVGYRCTCVPSCPTCRDCPAQVCVPELGKQCHTACDCSPGLVCDGGRCSAGTAPVFCCESDRCPVGQQCQHSDGRSDRCGQQCHTACDCEPGVGCFDGQCIAGFAPVFCCEADRCPAGQQCQHRDGRQDRCGQACVTQAWRCDTPGNTCEQDRVCACSASCPGCADCGPGVCLPRGTATPYRCAADGSCSQPGDRCLCVASCPACNDCALNVCVPSCDPMCDRRERMSSRRIDHIVELTRQCASDAECAAIDISTGCRPTCGAWVNQRYAERVKKLVDYLDQRYCATFAADGCAKPAVQCGQQRGACMQGLCTGMPAGQ